jgi:hypothetical protein
MLHRARAALKADMEKRWISPTITSARYETKPNRKSRNRSMQ